MLKLVPLSLSVVLLSLGGAACEKKKSPAELKAQEDIRKKAERKVQAAKFYGKLVEKFPDSEYAEQAKKRLQEIGPAATPARKP